MIATSFRTLPPFELVRADTIPMALDALAGFERPAILAGGTDWPARFNAGDYPDGLVDIARLKELHEIFRDGETLVIGAAVTHAAGASHSLVREAVPGFAAAWKKIANIRIRMSATLGGNIMSRRTRYEGAILASAMRADLVFATSSGELRLPAEDIWTHKLPKDALLVALRIPLASKPRMDYERSLRPIFTQALMRDASGGGRLVSATEYVVPVMVDFAAGATFEEIARPVAFRDPVTGADYLNKVRLAFLRRQTLRLEAA